MPLFTLQELDRMSQTSLPLALTQAVVGALRTQIARPPSGAPPGSEAVCPFVPDALELGLVLAGWHEAESMEEIKAHMLLAQSEFLVRFPLPPDPRHVFKSDMIVFPRQIEMDPTEQRNAFMNLRHDLSMNNFLAAGLMIGFFQQSQNLKGGPSFSTPLMIIRYLVRRDLNFLLKNNDPEEARVFAQVYGRLFNEKV